MGMKGDINVYVKALNAVHDISRLVTLPEDCKALLGSRVRVPIQLPLIRDTYKEVLKKKAQDIQNAVREYAKGIGVNEVVVPYLDVCVPYFRTVSIDSLVIDVQDENITSTSKLVGVVIDPENKPVRRFPLAWWWDSFEKEYVDFVSVMYLTALFVRRNPWFIDALRYAIDKALSDYRESYDDIVSFYNALKLIGAKD